MGTRKGDGRSIAQWVDALVIPAGLLLMALCFYLALTGQ